jgi:hypothetical protein
MEHREVEALLELAAVEPEGFERLAAGDTVEAAAIAGHLAGCPACTERFERLGRSAVVIRDTVRALPPADLRERTLARVAAEGRVRDRVPPAGGDEAAPTRPAGDRRPVPTRWVAALAAVLVVAIVGGAGWWWTAERLGDAEATVATLTRVAGEAGRIAALPDARTVGLTGDAGAGWLIFSSSAGEVAVETAGLPEPGPGQEYRCWVQIGEERTVMGRMWVDGDIAWWVGPTTALAGVGSEATFGVSLVELDAAQPGTPMLTGEL